MDIVIIDICGTIFNSNTTFDFLDFHFKENAGYKCFRRISKMIIWRLLNKCSVSLLGIDITRKIAVKSLKGLPKNQLKKFARDFYDSFLSFRIQQEVINEICALNTGKNRVIIVSATLDFIAEEVAKRMDIHEYYSTTLKYGLDGKCSGIIEDDLLGSKLNFLKKQQINPPYYSVITDNLSDMDLILNSFQSIIITTSKTRNIWKKKLGKNSIKDYKVLCL